MDAIRKTLLILTAWLVSWSMLRAEDYVLDFSTKEVQHGAYGMVWGKLWPAGGIEWEISGARNQGYSYVWFGGKSSKPGVSYVRCMQPLSMVVEEMVLDVLEIDKEIKTFKLYVAKDADFDDLVEVVSLTAGKGQISFLPEKEEVWLSDMYYKLEVCWNSTQDNKTAKISKLTFKEGVPPPVYTITATSNDETLGTVSVDGKTITAVPAKCSDYATPAYTVLEGEAELSRSGNVFSITPKTDCSIQINFISLETYSVLLDAGNGTLPGDGELLQTECNEVLVLPEAVPPCEEWTFAGWSELSVDETETLPELIPSGEYVPPRDVILYAVYKKQGDGADMQEMTMTVDETTGWEVNDKVLTQKNQEGDYYLLCKDAAIYSPAFDLGTIVAISARVRSYNAKKMMGIADEAGDEWGTITAAGTEMSSIFGVKTQNLTGVGRLVFTGLDVTEKQGIGVSSITITCQTVPTQYHSNPTCEPGSGTGLPMTDTNLNFYLDGHTLYFHAVDGLPVELYDVTGQLLDRRVAVSGRNSLQLSVGSYLLRAGGAVAKVIVW